jgi:hypothetical protein
MLMSLKGGAHEHTPAATTSFEPGPQTTIPTAADAVTLSEADRSRLQTFIHTGHASARMRTRAQVLLKLGEGWSLVEVCRAFDVRRNSIVRVHTLR